jgi:hypothetical protein
MAFLAALLLVVFVIALMVNHQLGVIVLRWFLSKPGGEAPSTALATEASVAIVAWTGALIAFQLRGVSFQLEGAFTLLAVAFVGPLIALLSEGPLLRTFAAASALYFVSRVFVQLGIYVMLNWLTGRMVQDRTAAEIAATETGRRLLKAIASFAAIPATYAAISALTSIAVVVYPTGYAAAWGSLVTLVSGINLVLVSLKRNQPTAEASMADPELSAKFDSIVALIKARAERLKGKSTEKTESNGRSSPASTDETGRSDHDSRDDLPP